MSIKNHGDPFDFPDVPGESGLGGAYRKSIMPSHVLQPIAARRRAEVAPPPDVTPRYESAVAYATAAHDGQIRKGTDLPYITHPKAVSELVAQFGGDEDQLIAALLHDVLEDCGEEHAPEIEVRFGARVLAIVRGCTDGVPDVSGRKAPWRKRKDGYLAHLAEADLDTLLVSACDKLHNLRCIVDDLNGAAGVNVFKRFTASRAEVIWYYGALVDVFARRLRDHPAAVELQRTVAVFAAVAGGA